MIYGITHLGAGKRKKMFQANFMIDHIVGPNDLISRIPWSTIRIKDINYGMLRKKYVFCLIKHFLISLYMFYIENIVAQVLASIFENIGYF